VLSLPGSTVRTIKINKNIETAVNVVPLCASKIRKSRDKVMEDTEKLLEIWL
jgi:hypothetical protein